MHIGQSPQRATPRTQVKDTPKDTAKSPDSSRGEAKSNLFDGAHAGHDHEHPGTSGGLPFNNPMDDADTLMRAILANYVEHKPTNTPTTVKTDTAAGILTESGEAKALSDVKEQVQSRFKENASDKEAFHSLMKKSFGESYDQTKAENIRQQALNGDFSWMPEIKLVDAATLSDTSGQQGAGMGKGAYSKETDTIYLSRELVASEPDKAVDVLTEEVGHALDARINTSDAAGDEGRIFAILSGGGELTNTELQELRSENDSGTIVVDGKEVEVEFFFKKLVKSVKKGFKKVTGAIKKGVKKVAGAIEKGVKKVGNAIKKGVAGYWNAVKGGFEKLMNSKLFNAVLMVAQFIPIPVVQVAVRVINIAKAAYGVYQGVKHGSLAMVAGGVASAFGGAGKLGSALGSTASWIDTAGKIATTAKYVGAAHQVISEKSLSGAASLAANYFGADSTAASVLNTAVKVDNVRQAVENDNLFGVVSSGTSLLQDFTGAEGDAFLNTINKHSSTIQQIDTARKSGDYSQALGLLRENFGDSLNIPQSTQQTLQRIEGGIKYAQTVDRLIDNKDYVSAAGVLLDTAASHVTHPGTQANIHQLGNTITTVDNAVNAYNDGRFNDAVGFAANAVGQPLNDKTRAFVNTVQARANSVENLVQAVKARDVDTASALLRELSNGKNAGMINLIEKAGNTANTLDGLKNAIDKKDFATAVGLVNTLSTGVTGKGITQEQSSTVQRLVTAVENREVTQSAALLNELTGGQHGNVLSFIQTADSVVKTAEDLKSAIEDKDFSTAIGLANTLAQDVSGKALPEQLITAKNLIDAVESGNITDSAALLRELTNGKHSQIIDVFDSVGTAVTKVTDLQNAIENKQYSTAAGLATELSQQVIGRDNTLIGTLSTLSDVLAGKVEVRMDSLPGGTLGRPPGINAGIAASGFGGSTVQPMMANGFGSAAVAGLAVQPEFIEIPAAYKQELNIAEPILLHGAVSPRVPTASELGAAADRAQQRLERGDRAGAYIELYQVTGNEQLLLQAQITVYSGAVGGMALEGNFRAKMANPDNYKITLDQFSYDIDQAVVELAVKMSDQGTPDQFNTLGIMEADTEVWKDNKVASHFPGNAQFIGMEGYEQRAESPGSQIAILAQDEIELGRRPAEYADDPRYTTSTSQDGRFVTVVNNETNRIEVFFDNEFDSDRGSELDRKYVPDLEQIDNEIPTIRIAAERQMKMDFLQAGKLVSRAELPEFNADAVRPPENLDRVFEYDGKLYQVSDKALFEKHGVDIGALTRDEGINLLGEEYGNHLVSLWTGRKFGAALNEVGTDVENIVEDRYWFDSNWERDFQKMVGEGIIKPLSSAETEYYRSAVESVGSPYQSTDDAMKQLGENLFKPIMYLGENKQDGPSTSDNV